jgi:hypothetical protein
LMLLLLIADAPDQGKRPLLVFVQISFVCVDITCALIRRMMYICLIEVTIIQAHVCMYVCMHVRMHDQTNDQSNICRYACTSTHACMIRHTITYIVFIRRVCMHVYVCICDMGIYVCICDMGIYTCMHDEIYGHVYRIYTERMHTCLSSSSCIYTSTHACMHA